MPRSFWWDRLSWTSRQGDTSLAYCHLCYYCSGPVCVISCYNDVGLSEICLCRCVLYRLYKSLTICQQPGVCYLCYTSVNLCICVFYNELTKNVTLYLQVCFMLGILSLTMWFWFVCQKCVQLYVISVIQKFINIYMFMNTIYVYGFIKCFLPIFPYFSSVSCCVEK